MRWAKFNFTDDFQDAILACLIRHPQKFFGLGQVIKPGFFNGPSQVQTVFHLLEYHKEQGKYPNFTTLGNYAFYKVSRNNVNQGNEIVDYVAKLSEVDTTDWKGVLALCIDFARERAIYDAVRKIHAAQSEGKMDKINAVQTVEEALRVGTDFDTLGKSLYHDSSEIIDTVTKRDYGVMTGYPELDKVWKFGWAPGWLIVPLAPPKRFKCLGINELVMMADGSTKAVQNIRINDLIMGDDSTPRKVLSCGKGYGPLYRVSQSNGNSYVCNDAHVLCVQRIAHAAPKGIRFKNRYSPDLIKEITAEEYARQPAWFKRTWKGYKVGVDFPAQPVPLDAYFLGLWLGDGTSAEPVIKPGRTHWKNPAVAALKSLHVLNNKHIPKVYKINSREVRLRLLAGLLDSGGHRARNKGFIFANTNQKLSDDVCWLARSLGFKAYTRKVKTHLRSIGYRGTAFSAVIQGKISEIPTKIPRKRGIDSFKATNRNTIKVKPIGNGDYYGFTIDGNGRFLLDDFTVTHNTTFCINLALNMACKLDTDVLYYACEISQELAMMRAIYNLSGFTEEQIFRNPEKLKPLVEQKLKQKMFGNVWFKGFPAKSASMSQIRDHAKQTIQIYGLNPKAIFIDYAETVKPDKIDKTVPDWRQQADIYIQARALGAELGCAVIMPDRCNKDAVGRSVPSMKSFQGSFEKAGVVDVAIGLCADDGEHKQNRMRYFIFLNRHGEAMKHYTGRVEPQLMKMTIDKEIDYNPDEDEGDLKPRRRGDGMNGPPKSSRMALASRNSAKDSELTQKD